jgi:hypothetical protein
MNVRRLVGEQEERLWDRKSHRLGGLEVDDQLVAGRQLKRQVTRLRTLTILSTSRADWR